MNKGVFPFLVAMVTLPSCHDGVTVGGNADPTTLVKVSLQGERYVVPANCFDGVVQQRNQKSGYFPQEDILLAFVWPSFDCRNAKNSSTLNSPGFGRRIEVLVHSPSAVPAETLLDRLLIIALFPKQVKPLDEPVPNDASPVGNEAIYAVNSLPEDKEEPVSVAKDVDGKYIAYCKPKPLVASSPAAGPWCKVIFVRHGSIIEADFGGALFNERRAIFNRINDVLNIYQAGE